MSTRPSRPSRPVNTIYCEAKCPHDEIFYFGSDDDQYDSPRERKRRYELAGQRFLAGSTPRLLSSSLRGPFESSKGWKNPWASKTKPTQSTQQPECQSRSVSKSNTAAKAGKPIDQRTAHTRSSKLECHLPSPRSLNTASLSSDRHPFLEDEDLEAVQAWRRSVRESEPCAVQPQVQTDDAASVRKRKAGHNWLKTTAPKKPRVEAAERSAEDAVIKSFNSAPERLETSRAITFVNEASREAIKQETTATARLQPTTKFIKRETASQLISPPKQLPTTKSLANPTVPTNNGHGEELSREEQAAATLSSPVSLRKVKQEKPETQPSPLKFKAKTRAPSDTSDTSLAAYTTKSPGRASRPGTTTDILNGSPARAIQDADFVINVTLDSSSELSELSESEDEELSELSERVDEELSELSESEGSELSELSESEDGEAARQASAAVSEEAQPITTILEDEDCSENDDASDSDLTELSYSPDISDLGEYAGNSKSSERAVDEAEEEYIETPTIGEFDEVEHVEEVDDVLMAEAAADTTDSVVTEDMDTPKVLNFAVADGAPDAEIFQPSVEHAESEDVAMIHDYESGQEEDAPLSNIDDESTPASDTVVDRTVLSETVADGAEVSSMNCVSRSAITTEEPLLAEEALPTSASAADSLVQQVAMTRLPIEPLPKIKQEASEFSLKAMFKSFVPTSKWAQLTQLTSSPVQPSAEAMQELVLPSVEGDHAKATESAVTDSDPNAEESSISDSNSYETVPEASKEYQLLSEQDRDATLPAPQAPQRDTPRLSTENTVAPTCQDLPPKTQENDTMTGESRSVMEEAGAFTLAMVHDEVEQLPTEAANLTTTSERQSAEAVEALLSNDAATTSPPPSTPPAPVHTQARGCDSEPRFAFKSFAAFSTPSPERLRIRKRRTLPGSSLRHPSLSGILSSREPGSARRTSNRVSWALLPGEEDTCTAATTPTPTGGTTTTTTTTTTRASKSARDGRSSPPPRTPLAELPTASNEKFGKHFSSVVKRTDGLRHRFHVAADTDRVVDAASGGASSSQAASSQGPSSTTGCVAKSSNSDSLDTEMRDAPTLMGHEDDDDVENRGGPLRESTMSVEPLDMVEDMVREMGDFWQAWDVDAELNAAKKTAQSGVSATGSQSQNTWR